MRKFCVLVGLLFLLPTVGPLAGVASGAEPATGAEENKLAALERFLGEWEINGRWTTGEELHARNVMDWGIAKKFITAKTFVKNGNTEYQRYDGIMGWHPRKKSLYQITFAYDGDIRETVIESADKDTLYFGWKPFTEGEPSPVRQTIKFTDKDSYVWTVELKQGEEWKKLIEGTWTRKK
jgi:hypothetical protein